MWIAWWVFGFLLLLIVFAHMDGQLTVLSVFAAFSTGWLWPGVLFGLLLYRVMDRHGDRVLWRRR